MAARRERYRDDLSTIRLGNTDEGGRDDLVLRVVQQSVVSMRPLPRIGAVTVGRSEGATIRIDDPSVSRRHAILHMGGPLDLEDLGSANGTRVGGRRLDAGERVRVSLGDVIELGSVIVVVQRREDLGPAKEPTSRGFVEQGALKVLLQDVERIAMGTISVLVRGETGVGKEIVAEAIHRLSPRASRPFLRLNCAAFSEALLTSELFGHERGAFSGADQAKPGLLETAQGGTVLLDEVGELPLPLQAKLLRVFEEKAVLRVGGLKPRPIDVRFVAATNRDLDAEVARGAFRQDLLFRLNGYVLVVPPLRERRDEISPLASSFAGEVARQMGYGPEARISEQAMGILEQHAWPGNVRELRNVIERAVLLAAGGPVMPAHLALQASAAPQSVTFAPPADEAVIRGELAGIERRKILEALAQCAGNQTQAAKLLGISRGTLVARLDAFGLPRPRKRGE